MWVVCMVMREFRQGGEQVGRPSWELRFITCVVLWNKHQKVRVLPVLLCRDDPDRHNGASVVSCSPARRQILYANGTSQLQEFWNVLFICVLWEEKSFALGGAWIGIHTGVTTRLFEAKANQTSHGSVIWWMCVCLCEGINKPWKAAAAESLHVSSQWVSGAEKACKVLSLLGTTRMDWKHAATEDQYSRKDENEHDKGRKNKIFVLLF